MNFVKESASFRERRHAVGNDVELVTGESASGAGAINEAISGMFHLFDA